MSSPIGSVPGSWLGTLVLSLASLAGAVSAQSMLGSWVGTGHPGFGAALSPLGDVNGDGHDDVLVVADPGGEPGHPIVVQVISGRTGQPLATFHEPGIPSFGQAAAGLGDVDGDGLGDVAVAAPDHPQAVGSIYVYSALEGRLLLEIHGQGGRHFGTAVAGLDDVNADGHADFVVGAPASSAPKGFRNHQTTLGTTPVSASVSSGRVDGRVLILSGADGSVLREVAGEDGDRDFGRQLAPVGDVNGDGLKDFAAVTTDETGEARVVVHSGANGNRLRNFSAGHGDPVLALEAIGDVNRDGWQDVLFFHSDEQQVVGHSGKTGARVLELPIGAGTAPPSFTAAGDIDIDGRADLLVRRPDGRVDVISVRSQQSLFELATTVRDEFPATASVAPAGDLDGDGYPDMVVGQPWLGRVTALSGHRYWSDVGYALAGTYGEPHLSTIGIPEPGQNVIIQVTGALENRPALLVYGRAQMNASLFGGILVPMPNISVDGLMTDAAGEIALSGAWPPGLPTPSVFFLQVWISDPAGVRLLSATNGIVGALH